MPLCHLSSCGHGRVCAGPSWAWASLSWILDGGLWWPLGQLGVAGVDGLLRGVEWEGRGMNTG